MCVFFPCMSFIDPMIFSASLYLFKFFCFVRSSFPNTSVYWVWFFIYVRSFFLYMCHYWSLLCQQLQLLSFHFAQFGSLSSMQRLWGDDDDELLSGKTNQDCKDKDGNNPVTLGLENMRGVIFKIIIIVVVVAVIIIIFLLLLLLIVIHCLIVYNMSKRQNKKVAIFIITRCSSWSGLA